MTTATKNKVKVNGQVKKDKTNVDALVNEANNRASKTQSMLDNMPINVLMANTDLEITPWT